MPAHPSATFIGHSTLRLDLDGLRILTDPVLRSRIGPLTRQGPAVDPDAYAGVDAVLISHLHHDHLDLPSLRRLSGGPRLVVPRGSAGLLARAGFRDVVELVPGRGVTLGPIRITATQANHRGDRSPIGPRGPALGYVIDDARRRYYFAGDTDLFEAMAELQDIDVAFLPVGGWGPTLGAGHLDPGRAARAADLIAPRLAVPIHWGTFWPRGLVRIRPHLLSGPAAAFEAAASEVAPGVVVSPSVPGDDVDLAAIR
jgi:L-ascorbate metabolism protein UlaG (beta-lactamase superfamily)